uniref:Uncharacterized protein n=1 Tax=Cuerna arida TaxID=1464854 RepID=A0A1B6GE87_9HEMI
MDSQITKTKLNVVLKCATKVQLLVTSHSMSKLCSCRRADLKEERLVQKRSRWSGKEFPRSWTLTIVLLAAYDVDTKGVEKRALDLVPDEGTLRFIVRRSSAQSRCPFNRPYKKSKS